MKNIKFNLDRPGLDSKSIEAGKDFDGLLKNHAIMSKPLYKSPWFIGTTGLASIGLVVGGIAATNYLSSDPLDENQNLTESSAPPEHQTQNLIAMNSNIEPKNKTNDLVKETFTYSENIQKQLDDKNPTLEQNSQTNNVSSQAENTESIQNTAETNNNSENQTDFNEKNKEEVEEINEESGPTSLMPRIGGKLNGSITKNQLFDNKGITTESDVNVIHFELHLIDGLGGKVFEEESNQLNGEMKKALKKINSGETIYFENIKGKTDQGEIVRLNPLRYVLMN